MKTTWARVRITRFHLVPDREEWQERGCFYSTIPWRYDFGLGIDDDVRVFVTEQRGFRSRGFKGVYLSTQESRVRRYHELIDDYVEGRLPQ
ncbi:MAG: hypothetical protein IH908_01160 [Proteobacteria bacterium]|nr:hypothetical protein [Pseudomonadota bacterium]